MKLTFTSVTAANAKSYIPYIPPFLRSTLSSGLTVAAGVMAEGLACGAALVSRRDGVGRLQSLFVDPGARRLGAGRGLALAAFSLSGCRSIRADFSLPDDSAAAVNALLRGLNGQAPERRGGVYEIGLGQSRETPFFARFGSGAGGGSRTLPLSEAPEELLLPEALPDFLSPAFRRPFLLPELSRIWLHNGGVPACVLIRREAPERVSLSAWTEAGAASCFLPLLADTARGLYAALPPETRVEIVCVSRAAEGMCARLLGKEYLTAGVYRWSCALEVD